MTTITTSSTTAEDIIIMKEALAVMKGIRVHITHATKKHKQHCCCTGIFQDVGVREVGY
jgi:hypothetical protein